MKNIKKKYLKIPSISCKILTKITDIRHTIYYFSTLVVKVNYVGKPCNSIGNEY